MNATTTENDFASDFLYDISSVYLGVVALLGIGLNSKALRKLMEVAKVRNYAVLSLKIPLYSDSFLIS